MNTQQQQMSLPPGENTLLAQGMRTDLTVVCPICDAVYAPSPNQLPFLQYTQGTLEAAFMSMCHFCFRCRRAACPQCWDEVHGVCGSCVLEAHLPFRSNVPPLEGLLFPPSSKQTPVEAETTSPLFVAIRAGRFAPAIQAAKNIDTDPHVLQSLPIDQIDTQGEIAAVKKPGDSPVSSSSSGTTPLPEVLEEPGKQASKPEPQTVKKVKKTSQLEIVLTWVVLVILVLLIVLIALAEYFPAVNAFVVHVVHIDIHTEVAYLVHVVQQLFKK